MRFTSPDLAKPTLTPLGHRLLSLSERKLWNLEAPIGAREPGDTLWKSVLVRQTVQAAAGSIGQPPFATNAAAFQQPIQVQGRLSNPDEFAEIVIKTDAEGRVTRVRDVARVELGAQDYGIEGYFDGQRGVGIEIGRAHV